MLVPVIAQAPADNKTREKWLARLSQAVDEDGVGFLEILGERWGELCGSKERASASADRLMAQARARLTREDSGSVYAIDVFFPACWQRAAIENSSI